MYVFIAQLDQSDVILFAMLNVSELLANVATYRCCRYSLTICSCIGMFLRSYLWVVNEFEMV